MAAEAMEVKGKRRRGKGIDGRRGATKKKTYRPQPLEKHFQTKNVSLFQDDIFEWYFAIRGPRDSDFEGGIYLGRLTLPPDYPLAPPSFTMLTRSGRFETGVRICLSISSFHADLWSPSWSVRSALLALAAFMPTPAGGAVGGVEGWPSEEVKAAALASRAAAPRVSSGNGGGSGGSAAARRQAVVERLHASLLAFEEAEKGKGKEKVGGEEKDVAAEREEEEALAAASAEAIFASSSSASSPPPPAAAAAAAEGAGGVLRQRQLQTGAEAATATEAAATAPPAPRPPPPVVARAPSSSSSSSSSSSWEDALLTALAGALLFAIAGILARKILLRIL